MDVRVLASKCSIHRPDVISKASEYVRMFKAREPPQGVPVRCAPLSHQRCQRQAMIQKWERVREFRYPMQEEVCIPSVCLFLSCERYAPQFSSVAKLSRCWLVMPLWPEWPGSQTYASLTCSIKAQNQCSKLNAGLALQSASPSCSGRAAQRPRCVWQFLTLATKVSR
jgi:hypothetical protein